MCDAPDIQSEDVVKGDDNKLLSSYKVRFNTQQKYKSSGRCCVCVYVTETKYALRNLSAFLLAAARGKKEEGHEEFLSRLPLFPMSGGKKRDTQTS